MPEVIQEKPNRTPQKLAVVASVVLVLLVGSVVVWLKVLDTQKKAFEAAKNSAQDRFAQHDYKGQASAFQNYLDSRPPKKYSDQIYVDVATAYLNANDYDKAVEYYQKTDQVNSKDHGKALNGLALAYDGKGDSAKALDNYNQLLDLTKKSNSADKNFEIKSIESEIKRIQEESK